MPKKRKHKGIARGHTLVCACTYAKKVVKAYRGLATNETMTGECTCSCKLERNKYTREASSIISNIALGAL